MDLEHLAKVDKLKTKMLKYIFYKKRTEHEIREKFKNEESDILEETIENLKDLGYIDDNKYVDRFMHEAISIKNLSIYELKYKLYSKGVSENVIDEYISENREMMKKYKIMSARNILNKKKNNMEFEEIVMYLRKKRYSTDTINQLKEEWKKVWRREWVY